MKGRAHPRHVRSRSGVSTSASHRAQGLETPARPPWHNYLRRARLVARSSQPTRARRANSESSPRLSPLHHRRSRRAMDAARPVDAQPAPTGLWKTADGFPQRPQPVIVFLVQERSRARNGLTGGRQSRFLRFLATADTAPLEQSARATAAIQRLSRSLQRRTPARGHRGPNPLVALDAVVPSLSRVHHPARLSCAPGSPSCQ